jgi:hypothetical protein
MSLREEDLIIMIDSYNKGESSIEPIESGIISFDMEDIGFFIIIYIFDFFLRES